MISATQAVIPATSSSAIEVPVPTSAYIHLPFCRRRCHYCDFTIVPVGDRVNSALVSSRMETYVALLCKEIEIAGRHACREGTPREGSLQTVFFGGGTPSLLPPLLLRKVIAALNAAFGIAPEAEVSMEMDPGTFDRGKLDSFLDLGINRVSLGVQSFSDNLLQACGRSHGLAEVYGAISTIQDAAIPNWSLDLMSSLPTQTLPMWRHSLSQAVEAKPSHISVYDLQVEPGTAFGRWYTPGETPLPSDSSAAQMYKEASEVLSREGYEHYEISNYCRSGMHCKHNLVYWNNEGYHGFGLGAASYAKRQRVVRPKRMEEYREWVESYEANEGLISWPYDEQEDRLLDKLMLGLRLADGVSMSELEQEFGEDIVNATYQALARYERSGHVQRISNDSLLGMDGVRMRLSDPKGFLMSNDIISSLFNDLTTIK